MRSLVAAALLGSLLLVTGVQAQSLSEHAAAAAGATIGTAAGKPLSNAITKIFGQVDSDAQKAAGVKTEAKPPAKAIVPDTGTSTNLSIKPSGESAPLASTETRRSAPAASRERGRATATYLPVAAAPAAVQEPPRREPTAEELASVKVGAAESDVLATLGQPESRVTIPDEGHLLQICQYWANGQPLGTVRLDNGQVVSVEPKS
jgi:hypothetical protein